MKLTPEELKNIKRLLLSEDEASIALGYELSKKAPPYLNELKHPLVIVAMLLTNKPLRNKIRRYLGRHFSSIQYQQWKVAFDVFHKFHQYYHYYPEAAQMIEQHEAIRKEFEPTFKQAAHLAKHYYEIARIFQYRLKQRPDLARDYYNIVIASDPTNHNALFNLGHLYQTELFDQKNSEACYLKVIAIKPDMGVAYNNLGSLRSNNPDQVDEAIAYYQKALQFNPNYNFYKCNLAGAYLTAGQYEKFEEILQEVFKNQKNYKRAINQWANYLWEYKKDYKAAKQAYEDGLRYYPKDQFLTGNYGELHEYVFQDYEKAFVYYQRSLNLGETTYRLILMVALLVNHLEDFEQAQQYYETLQNNKEFLHQRRNKQLSDRQWQEFLAAEKKLFKHIE